MSDPTPPTVPPIPPTPEAEAEQSAHKVWRRVAFARRSAKVFTRGGLQHVLGGEILDDPSLVATLGGDEAFQFFELRHRDELEELRADYAGQVAELRERAAKLGLVVYRHGEIEPPRRRG